MEKVLVVYWSQTGNTEAMANAVLAGANSDEAAAGLYHVGDISAAQAAKCGPLARGCPAMGSEVLEESVFEPFFAQLEGMLKGKKVALFGSYGWGDGQWMRDWEDRVVAAGAELVNGGGLILNETPDPDGLAACEALGKALARD